MAPGPEKEKEMVTITDEKAAYLTQPRSRTELRKLVTDLLRSWGIRHYFASIQDIDSTSAVSPARKILIVDEKLLGWGTPAVQAMVLHEIGHIDRGHILSEHDDELLNYVDEYEADEFAFDAIQTLYGYVPVAAGLWLLETRGTWRWDWDTPTHPSLSHRWERLAWNSFVPEDAQTIHRALGLVNPKEYYEYG